MFKFQFFISAKPCTTAACCGCVVQRRQDNIESMRHYHDVPRERAKKEPLAQLEGGTEGKVKIISTLFCHTNSICWWWATVSTPQGWGQSIAAGADLHQPPEAVLGFAPCGMSSVGQPELCCSIFNSPSSARSTVYHWICGTLSRSCLLFLIAVQCLTRKTSFLCCTRGPAVVVC